MFLLLFFGGGGLGDGRDQARVAEATWIHFSSVRGRDFMSVHVLQCAELCVRVCVCPCVCPFDSCVKVYGSEPQSQSVRWASALLTVWPVSLWVKATKAF